MTITVNGVMLHEYLRDNESIEDEIKGREYIRESRDNIYPGRHIKPKYRDHKEKNGEVRVLNELEKNHVEFENRMASLLRTKKYTAAMICIIVSMPDDDWLTIKKLADIIENFCGSRNIPLDPKFRHAMRAKIGHLQKTELADYVDFVPRRSAPNNMNALMFRVDREKAANLSADRAIKLGSVRRKNVSRRKNSPQNDPPAIKLSEELSKEPKQVIKAPAAPEIPDKPKAVNTIVDVIRELAKDKSIINVRGNLHIHVHFDK